MKAMEPACKRELASLSLLAGDGDFRDCVEFIAKEVKKKVSIFAYRNSFNKTLEDVAGKDQCFMLDEIWEKISEPLPSE